jgi:hypothetical protein
VIFLSRRRRRPHRVSHGSAPEPTLRIDRGLRLVGDYPPGPLPARKASRPEGRPPGRRRLGEITRLRPWTGYAVASADSTDEELGREESRKSEKLSPPLIRACCVLRCHPRRPRLELLLAGGVAHASCSPRRAGAYSTFFPICEREFSQAPI